MIRYKDWTENWKKKAPNAQRKTLKELNNVCKTIAYRYLKIQILNSSKQNIKQVGGSRLLHRTVVLLFTSDLAECKM